MTLIMLPQITPINNNNTKDSMNATNNTATMANQRNAVVPLPLETTKVINNNNNLQPMILPTIISVLPSQMSNNNNNNNNDNIKLQQSMITSTKNSNNLPKTTMNVLKHSEQPIILPNVSNSQTANNNNIEMPWMLPNIANKTKSQTMININDTKNTCNMVYCLEINTRWQTTKTAATQFIDNILGNKKVSVINIK